MIVADTGGVLALLNRKDAHHAAVVKLFKDEGKLWIFPWAVLPEVDYLAAKYFGREVADAFVADIKDGAFRVDASIDQDLDRAVALMQKYRDLGLGLVDAVVMAQAERHRATTIVTTDARHFRAVALRIKPPPRLVPLDR